MDSSSRGRGRGRGRGKRGRGRGRPGTPMGRGSNPGRGSSRDANLTASGDATSDVPMDSQNHRRARSGEYRVKSEVPDHIRARGQSLVRPGFTTPSRSESPRPVVGVPRIKPESMARTRPPAYTPPPQPILSPRNREGKLPPPVPPKKPKSSYGAHALPALTKSHPPTPEATPPSTPGVKPHPSPSPVPVPAVVSLPSPDIPAERDGALVDVTTAGENNDGGQGPGGEDDRMNVLREILETEEKYVESLNTMHKFFVLPIKSSMGDTVAQDIFSNLPMIIQVNSDLLESLRERIRDAQSGEKADCLVGDIFFSTADYLKLYSAYTNNLPNARVLVQRTTHANPAFAKMLQDSMAQPEVGGATLQSFLIQPVQRICRYELLLRELAKHTAEVHEDFELLGKAREKVHAVATYVDEQNKQAENVAKIFGIQQSLSGLGKKTVVSPGRMFIREGKVAQHLAKKHKPRHVFLFNDILLVASDTSGEGYQLKEWINLSELQLDLRTRDPATCPAPNSGAGDDDADPDGSRSNPTVPTLKVAMGEGDGERLRSCTTTPPVTTPGMWARCFQFDVPMKGKKRAKPFLFLCKSKAERDEWIAAILKCQDDKSQREQEYSDRIQDYHLKPKFAPSADVPAGGESEVGGGASSHIAREEDEAPLFGTTGRSISVMGLMRADPRSMRGDPRRARSPPPGEDGPDAIGNADHHSKGSSKKFGRATAQFARKTGRATAKLAKGSDKRSAENSGEGLSMADAVRVSLKDGHARSSERGDRPRTMARREKGSGRRGHAAELFPGSASNQPPSAARKGEDRPQGFRASLALRGRKPSDAEPMTRVGELEKENRDMKAELVVLERTVEQLTAENRALQTKDGEHLERVYALRNNLDSLTRSFEELRETHERLQREHTQLREAHGMPSDESPIRHTSSDEHPLALSGLENISRDTPSGRSPRNRDSHRHGHRSKTPRDRSSKGDTIAPSERTPRKSKSHRRPRPRVKRGTTERCGTTQETSDTSVAGGDVDDRLESPTVDALPARDASRHSDASFPRSRRSATEELPPLPAFDVDSPAMPTKKRSGDDELDVEAELTGDAVVAIIDDEPSMMLE